VILEHSIVGIDTDAFRFRKDREYAACRICGAVFQSELAHIAGEEEYILNSDIRIAIAIETKEWRSNHNKKHSPKEHILLRKSGLTFTPEAAHRLAPFGIVSLDSDSEIASALLEAPRAPHDDAESSTKRRR
jgi:hypothetical protein